MKPKAGEFQEKLSLQLLKEMQGCLDRLLDSFAGHSPEGKLKEKYIFYSSRMIERTADAFILLREADRIDASKFLIRPAIELTFKQQAVAREPEFLFNIAYYEHTENGKFYRKVYEARGEDFNAEAKRQWELAEKAFTEKYPDLQKQTRKLDAWKIAEKAELTVFYNSHYRLYSHFMHGTFEACLGLLDFSDQNDNPAMFMALYSALLCVHEILKVDCPELAGFLKRFDSLTQFLKVPGADAQKDAPQKSHDLRST